MPWELGKLASSASNPVIDTSEVIWVCTSNAGEQLVFDFDHSKDSNTRATRQQYNKLMTRMRGRMSEELGVRIIFLLLSENLGLTGIRIVGVDRLPSRRCIAFPSFHSRRATSPGI